MRDPSQAAIPSARVILERTGSRTKLTAESGMEGQFRFPNVSPGEYSVTVRFQGFEQHQAAIVVGPNAPEPLEIILNIESVREQITVAAATETVSTDSTENRSAVSQTAETLERLPMLDQDYLSGLARFLDPAAAATGGVTLVVDGVEANGVGVSASAIQEIKINNDPYSAQFSRPGRGRIEVITKSGTKDYHGTLNFLFRDQHLNARDAFAAARPPEQKRIYEGSVTGPLGNGKKNTFLVSFDRQEQDLQAVVFAQTAAGIVRENADAPQRRLFASGRATHYVNESQSFWIGYSYEDRTARNQGVGGTTLPEAGVNTGFREDEVTFSHRTAITKHLASQLRLLVGRFDAPATSVTNDPKIVVVDAFTGGGAQADSLRTERHWDGTELLTWDRGKHLVKFGIDVPDISRRGVSLRTNLLGTYSFSTLDDYAARHPFALVRQAGNGHVVFLEKVLAGFVQDQIQVRRNLSVSVGMRYYWQNFFGNDPNNFAPRLGAAWAPGNSRKTVIRAGGGYFYDRTGPLPIADTLLFDGVKLRRYVIADPAYPYTGPVAALPPGIVKLDPSLVIPYTVQFSGTLERQVAKAATLSVSYIGLRGVGTFRSRDANAPKGPLYTARPDPAFGQVREIESAGRLQSDTLELALRGKITKHFTGTAQYALAKARNNTTGINYFPADSNTYLGEWGRAEFDQRHRFNMAGTFVFGKWIEVGALATLTSAPPFNITTGRDANNDGLANDRPAGVTRNTGIGPDLRQFDIRWSHDFRLTRKKEKAPALTIAADAFNVSNRVNYTGYIGALSSPFFGQPVGSLPARRIQLLARFKF